MRPRTLQRSTPAAMFAAALLFQISPLPLAAAETGELAHLREQALALVNEARKEHKLAPLEMSDVLDATAQAHAEDMLERGYYSHTSPEGETARDRFRDQGGSRWKLVAENIARCSGCSTVPSTERVQAFNRGWMESPGHRRNILAEGLEGFGFGIVGENGRQFAVQTFAGPGTPPALQPGEEPVALSGPEQAAAAAAIINRERERQKLAPVEVSDALRTVAQRLLPTEEAGDGLIAQSDDMFSLLPGGATADWGTLNVVAAGCGGCGVNPTRADVRYFVDQWLQSPQHTSTLLGEAASHLGFAMRVNGEGRKVAILVAGGRR